MNNSSREEAKRRYRQNEIQILKDQWFQQDLREAEMNDQLEGLPLLPNLRNMLLYEHDLSQQKRREIQLNIDLRRTQAERKAEELKRKMRQQQIADLQEIWREQDMREAKAMAEAERLVRDLSVANQLF